MGVRSQVSMSWSSRVAMIGIVAAVSVVLLLPVPAEGAGEHRFGQAPFDAIHQAAIEEVAANSCAGLTANKLTALMLAVTWPETTNNDTSLVPSPMTLSRWDGWSLYPDGRNHLLYSHVVYANYKRAHWNPGVGLFQLDILGSEYSHAERMHAGKAASWVVAPEMRWRFCAFGLTSSLGPFQPWSACGSNDAICLGHFNNIYDASTDSINVDLEPDVAVDGGGVDWTFCRYGSSGTWFTCAWVDPDEAQGARWWVEEDPDGENAMTPVSAAHISARYNGRLRSHWLRSGTGYTIEIIRHVDIGDDPRVDPGYYNKGWYDWTSLQYYEFVHDQWLSW